MEENRQAKTFEEKVIEISRVSRTVKGGKRISFRALIIVGDKNGRVGMGIGKANEVATAIKKGANNAKNDLKTISINKAGSILKEVLVKEGSANVLLRPAPKGTSIIAGGVVRTVCELSGVTNLVTKSLGSNNKINVARVTIKALVEAGQNVKH